ncbi:hypothetical protein P7H62_09910 [Vagococcus carniphilus]|uniref:hypothetical protein n=1 Tax=Vagococcus carniphilus TaxID=218144 RepID=UPI0028920369|nr:hypothetical protein [Vagococcus carniphilus]MDT2830489.1 hypothetical protein [Vagococcus carniphilus]MDT2839787.1 hypothetical protein [Vagococcus carniphilus]MDT2854766.1 hypothetical protein [Vagococcus carniphilus]
MKKIIVFLLLILFPVNVWGEDDGPAELDALNRYEKTPIEQVVFEKQGRKINGYSRPGALITTDFGESMEVPESGEFSFEVPKDIQMVIINAINQEGLEPNSIMFNLVENRLLSDGEETPPPNAPNIKEKKQEKKENQKPKENIKEKEKKTGNTENKKEPLSTEKKDQTTISKIKTKQAKSTDSSIEEVANQTKSNVNFWRWLKISILLLLIIGIVAVTLSGKLIKEKTREKKKRKMASKKKKKVQ